jgi:hypothetical protein
MGIQIDTGILRASARDLGRIACLLHDQGVSLLAAQLAGQLGSLHCPWTDSVPTSTNDSVKPFQWDGTDVQSESDHGTAD